MKKSRVQRKQNAVPHPSAAKVGHTIRFFSHCLGHMLNKWLKLCAKHEAAKITVVECLGLERDILGMNFGSTIYSLSDLGQVT